MENENAGGQGSSLDLGALLGMLGSGSGEQPGEGGVDFASLLGMLGGLSKGDPSGEGGEESGPTNRGGSGERGPSPPGLDPALLSTLSRAMAALREPDKNIQLLRALRPYLEPERQKKVDEAVKILHLMKLAPLLQESGLLSGLLGGEES